MNWQRFARPAMRCHLPRWCGVRYGWFAAAVIVLGAVPDSLFATLPPSEDALAYRLPTELARLEQVRERLERRRALEQALDRRLENLTRDIEALRVNREATWATLERERSEALRLERWLDQVVPRVLAREATVRERRRQTARLLADLASSSRQVELDPAIKARMLAVGPLMLERLHNAEAGLAALRREPEQVAARHRAIEARIPVLMVEGQRLEQERAQRSRERDAVAERLAETRAEVAQLRDEARALARQVLVAEAAYAAGAAPRADQPALEVAAADVVKPTSDAVVKGILTARSQPARAVDALQPVRPQVIAAAWPAPHRWTASGEPAPAALPPPPAKPIHVALKGDLDGPMPGLGDFAKGGGTLDAVFLEPTPLAGIRSRVAPAELPPAQAPIMPVPGEVRKQFDGDDGPGISIAAQPGQAVAAPDSGRVVFAGPFKSYGLLLIIEHEREYHTLLWGFSRLDVDVGDRVRTGQVVGVVGAAGERRPELHVELRRNGRPVNPLPWLAASNSRVRG